MRKVLFAFVVLVSASSLSFAQTPATPAAPVAQVEKPAAAEVKSLVLSGKVDSVVAADEAKGVKPAVVLVDEKGEKVTFTLGPKTAVTDVDGKAITLEKIVKDQKIMVSYSIDKDGVNEAGSIAEVK